MSRVDLSKYLNIPEPDDARFSPIGNSTRLAISEIIVDTVQGENLIGNPAVFLRLAGCSLDCVFCDTSHVWNKGISFTVNELMRVFYDAGILFRLERGERLIITGGSPLLQQDALNVFLSRLRRFVVTDCIFEIENEVSVLAYPVLRSQIQIWNNSPKLENSGVPLAKRYNVDAIKQLTRKQDYFKFVVSKETDWEEINTNFLENRLIKREQIVLMPLGKTRAEIAAVQETVVQMAISHGVRYSPRLHIDIWDGADGV